MSFALSVRQVIGALPAPGVVFTFPRHIANPARRVRGYALLEWRAMGQLATIYNASPTRLSNLQMTVQTRQDTVTKYTTTTTKDRR